MSLEIESQDNPEASLFSLQMETYMASICQEQGESAAHISRRKNERHVALFPAMTPIWQEMTSYDLPFVESRWECPRASCGWIMLSIFSVLSLGNF